MATQLTKLMRRLREAGCHNMVSLTSVKNQYMATVHAVTRTADSPEAAISAAVEAAILARKIPHVST